MQRMLNALDWKLSENIENDVADEYISSKRCSHVCLKA